MSKQPKNPFHPGEILLDEFLEPWGMSRAAFAEEIGWINARVNELICGKGRVTAEAALDLAEALGTWQSRGRRGSGWIKWFSEHVGSALLAHDVSVHEGMSPYFQDLRSKVGHALLLVPSVAAVIRNGDGELLLQQKVGGAWSLPAGAIEPGETPEDAVRREVLEETALLVEPTEIRGVFGGSAFRHQYVNGDTVEYTVVLFRCRVLGASTNSLDPETRSLSYFSRERMPALALPYPMEALYGGS
jgi:addiction module HigA family antidote